MGLHWLRFFVGGGGQFFHCKTQTTFFPINHDFVLKFSIFQKVPAWVSVDRVVFLGGVLVDTRTVNTYQIYKSPPHTFVLLLFYNRSLVGLKIWILSLRFCLVENCFYPNRKKIPKKSVGSLRETFKFFTPGIFFASYHTLASNARRLFLCVWDLM